MIMPLIDKAKDDAELINYYRKQYKKQARYSCIEEFGYLPKELCQKFLLKSTKCFWKYFDNNIEVEDKTNETVIKVNDNPTLDDNEKDTKQKYTSCIGLLRNCEYIKIPQVEKPIGRIDKYKALKDVMNSVI